MEQIALKKTNTVHFLPNKSRAENWGAAMSEKEISKFEKHKLSLNRNFRQKKHIQTGSQNYGSLGFLDKLSNLIAS